MGKGGANSWSLKHIGMNKGPVLDGRFRACRRRDEYEESCDVETECRSLAARPVPVIFARR